MQQGGVSGQGLFHEIGALSVQMMLADAGPELGGVLALPGPHGSEVWLPFEQNGPCAGRFSLGYVHSMKKLPTGRMLQRAVLQDVREWKRGTEEGTGAKESSSTSPVIVHCRKYAIAKHPTDMELKSATSVWTKRCGL